MSAMAATYASGAAESGKLRKNLTPDPFFHLFSPFQPVVPSPDPGILLWYTLLSYISRTDFRRRTDSIGFHHDPTLPASTIPERIDPMRETCGPLQDNDDYTLYTEAIRYADFN